MRDSAERALALQDINAQVIGNAPFIHYKNIYSKKYQESSGKMGEDVFVYKAFVQGTIHILRKHFYSTKLDMTSKFFEKTRFFRQN